MQVIQAIANVLHIGVEELERAGLKAFLEKELLSVESEMYCLGNKYGIKSVLELDRKLKSGKIREEEMREDFMALDHLESRREEILKALKKI